MKISLLFRGIFIVAVLLVFAYLAWIWEPLQFTLAVIGFLTVGKIIYDTLIKNL